MKLLQRLAVNVIQMNLVVKKVINNREETEESRSIVLPQFITVKFIYFKKFKFSSKLFKKYEFIDFLTT